MTYPSKAMVSLYTNNNRIFNAAGVRSESIGRGRRGFWKGGGGPTY